MSTKRKRRGKAQLFVRAQRDLAKGRAKEALKDAKICFRNDPCLQHREFLEQAYLGRAEQLYGFRLLDEARTTLAELAQLEPTAAEVRRQAARLRALLGECHEDSARLLEDDPSLLTEIADRAVIEPHLAIANHPQVKTQVQQVRQALVAVEQGDDEAAAGLVREIPRNSPLCDWKLLVRGLSAFYQGDRPRTDENWRRLDPGRPAWRIAQTLLVAAGQLRAEEAPVDVSYAVRKLESRLQTDPAGDALKRLSTLWQNGDWKTFLREYRTLRQRFAKTHAGLVEKIVDVTWKRAIRERDPWLLNQVASIGPAPPLDPHWNRAKALMAEAVGNPDVTPVADFWSAYARDLASVPSLREEERPIASGLVYLHLARQFTRYADDNAQPSLFRPSDEGSAKELRKDAAGYYRKAIEQCGQLAVAYHELAKLHERLEQSDRAATVLTKLVDVKPDDHEAHLWLANHYLGLDEPEKSQRHIDAMMKLKPRDERALVLRWNRRLTAIRCLVKQRQFEAARREAEEAARHASPEIEPYTLPTLRAGIEWKAKCFEAAQQHLAAALETVEEPTIVWMLTSCTAARFHLPRTVKKDFDDRFKEAIQRPPTSSTAGQLARFLIGLHGNQINYTGRATQERLFLKYLHRAKQTKSFSWQHRDLRDVCLFLHQLGKERQYQLVATGVKQFPHCPGLHFLAAEVAMDAGPFFCDYGKARFHMQQALQLARDARGLENKAIVERAQRALALLEETQQRMPSFSSIFDPDFDDDDDDDDEFDDQDDDGSAPWAKGFYAEEDDREDEYGGPPEEVSPDEPSADDILAKLEQVLPPSLIEQLQRIAQAHGAGPSGRRGRGGRR